MVEAERNKAKDSGSVSQFRISKSLFIYLNIFESFGPNKVTGVVAKKESIGNIIQISVCEVFIVLPIHFLMTLVGHYTHSSCVAAGYMQPIMTGFSFAVLVSSLLTVLTGVLKLRDVGVYVTFAIFQIELDVFNCLSYQTLDIICIDHIMTEKHMEFLLKHKGPLDTNNLVSSIFYNYVISKRKHNDIPEMDFLRVTLVMIYTILTILLPVTIFFLVQIKLSRILKIVKPLVHFTLIVFIGSFLCILTVDGSWHEVEQFYLRVANEKLFRDYRVWAQTLMRRVIQYSPLLINHISYASLLEPTVDTEMAAFQSWLAMYLCNLFKTSNYFAFKGALHPNYIAKVENIHSLATEFIFIFFPAAINYLFTGDTLFMGSMFICLFLSWIVQYTILIQLIFNSLTDIIPFAAQYKKYIVSFYLTFVAILSQFVFSREDSMVHIHWLDSSKIFPMWANLLLFLIFSLWFYGVTNLCDDIHFKVGHPTSIFWRITLWPLPLILFVTIFLGMTDYYEEVKEKLAGPVDAVYVIMILVFVSFCAPFMISVAYEVIHYVLNKKLMWLVKPQERWGDPDPEERKARRKYPPRLETKFRRRFDHCKHRCLRYSQVLHALDEKEYDTRAALLNLPQEIIQEKDYIYSILSKLKKK